ncbi:MAG: hypothetical protein ACMXYA_02095 [Candidatus Woesearchaeota archaeon]
MEFVHRQNIQKKFGQLECYGKRVYLPKKIIISIYTFLAVAIPVILPLPLVWFIHKYVPSFIRL